MEYIARRKVVGSSARQWAISMKNAGPSWRLAGRPRLASYLLQRDNALAGQSQSHVLGSSSWATHTQQVHGRHSERQELSHRGLSARLPALPGAVVESASTGYGAGRGHRRQLGHSGAGDDTRPGQPRRQALDVALRRGSKGLFESCPGLVGERVSSAGRSAVAARGHPISARLALQCLDFSASDRPS